MKTCNNCRIQVNSSREFCPLCGQTMARSTGEGYSAYPKLELPRRRFGRLKLLLIFTQVFLGITVLVDGFIRSTSYWYLVLLAGSAYTAVSALWAARRKNNPGGVILKEVLLISALSFCVDYFSGFSRWSTNYLIPLLVMGSGAAITAIILLRPVWFRDYFFYEFTLLVMGGLCMLLWVMGLATVRWTAFCALLHSLVTLTGLMLFAGAGTREELKKRFHL